MSLNSESERNSAAHIIVNGDDEESDSLKRLPSRRSTLTSEGESTQTAALPVSSLRRNTSVSSDASDIFDAQTTRRNTFASESQDGGGQLNSEHSPVPIATFGIFKKFSALFDPVVNSIWFERGFLLVTLAHNAYSLARGEVSNLSATSYMVEILFAALYSSQIIMIGFSLQLEKFLRSSICNRLDFVSAIFSWIEIAAWKNGVPFTLCSIRLFRIILPLTAHKEFQILDAILQVLNVGWAALGSVLLLIGLSFVFFGVVGVHAYSQSFRRRCVWADTLEIKLPEQWCKRYDGSKIDSDLGLHNNCGPLQLCHDIGDPNYGLTHFDHIGAAILALFQSFAGQEQSFVMWACLQSEPSYTAGTLAYFFLVTLILGQVLGNLHTAVLVGMYCQIRQQLTEFPARFKSAIAIVLTPSGNEIVTDTATVNNKLLDHLRTNVRALHCDQGVSNMVSEDVVLAKHDASVQANKTLLKISEEMARIFKRPWFEIMGLAAVTTNVMAIFLRGSLGAAFQDKQLALVERYCGYYFIAEVLIWVVCAGSLPNFFQGSKYHIFEFGILCSTVAGLLSDYMGVPTSIVAVIRNPSMFRLFRFLRSFSRWHPLDILWEIVQDCGRCLLPVLNLLVLVLFIVLCFAIFFLQIFSDKQVKISDRSDPQSLRNVLTSILHLFTGAGWADAVHAAMANGCHETAEQISAFSSALMYKCQKSDAVLFATVFIVFFWVTQYLCLPFFLALILETFDIFKIMQYGQSRLEDPFQSLEREEAKRFIAEFYGIPVQAVSKELLDEAMNDCAKESADSSVVKQKLYDWLCYTRPHYIWRFCRRIGLLFILNALRRYVCCCFKGWSCCAVFPGEIDSVQPAKRNPKVSPEELAKAREEQKRRHLEKIAPKLREQMTRLVKMGLAGEVRIIAAKMNLANRLPESIIDAEPEVALSLLRDPNLARRLGFQVPQDHNDNRRFEGAKGSAKQLKNNAKGSSRKKGFLTRLSQTLAIPCRKICDNIFFYVVVYGAILCSSLFLVFASPAPEIEPAMPQLAIDIAGYVFLLVLTSEVGLKILGYGFFIGISPEHKPFWFSLWNRLDMIVLILNWLELFGFLGLNGKNTIQILRLGRLVKVLSKFHVSSVKTMACALISSIRPFSLVILCMGLVISVASALGMSLFAGAFFSCNDNSIDGIRLEGQTECSGETILRGLYVPRVWAQAKATFDTFPWALLTVCRMFSSDWVQDLYHAADSNQAELGIQPIKDQNQGVAAFYYSFLIISIRFVLLNLVYAIVIESVIQSGMSDGYLRTDEISISLINKTILEHWPSARQLPANFISRVLQRVIHSDYYVFFSIFVITINIIFMSVEHAGESVTVRNVTKAGNDLGFSFFCIDLVITIIAYGFSMYLSSSRIWLDGTLIIAFVVTLSVEPSGVLRPALQVALAVRLVRPLSELTKGHRESSLSVIFNVLNLSGSHILSIVVLLFGGMTIFAVLGVMLFGNVKSGLAISAQANFRDYPSALLTLCQILIGDHWPLLMIDCSVRPPLCTENFVASGKRLSFGDCGVPYAPVYFLLFKIICDFLIFRLLLGIIFETYLSCTSKRKLEISDADIRRYSKVWTQYYDPAASGFIPVWKLNQLLCTLPPPLGIATFSRRRFLYLCVRHELELLSLDAVAAPSSSPVLGSYKYLARLEAKLWKPILEEWEISQKDHKLENHDPGLNPEFHESLAAQWAAELESNNEPEGGENSKKRESVKVSGGDFGKDHKKNRIKSGKRGKQQRRSRKMSKRISIEDSVEDDSQIQRRHEMRRRLHGIYAYFFPDPRPSWALILVTFLKWIVSMFISRYELCVRPNGYVRFDEVLRTILYWSPEVQSVPRSLRTGRSEFDRTILDAVAAKVVAAFCRGANARAHVFRESDIEDENESETYLDTEGEANRQPSETVELKWRESARDWALREDEYTDRGTLARIIAEDMLSTESILEAAQQLGLVLQANSDLFDDLDHVTKLCQHSVCAPLCESVRDRECLKRLLRAGHERILRMTGEGLGLDYDSLENITDRDLHALLADQSIQKKIFEVDGPTSNPTLQDIDGAEELATASATILDVQEAIQRAVTERDELLTVVEQTRARVQTMYDETSHLATVLGLEMIEFVPRPPGVEEPTSAPDIGSTKSVLAAPTAVGETTTEGEAIQDKAPTLRQAADIDVLEQRDLHAASQPVPPDEGEVARLRDAIAIKKAEIEHLARELRRVRAMHRPAALATAHQQPPLSVQGPGESSSPDTSHPASPDTRLGGTHRRRGRDEGREADEAESKGSALAAMGIEDSSARRPGAKASKPGEKPSAAREHAKRPAWL